MKFAEALAMALWLSLFAQIRCWYVIEIARQDSEKVKNELESDSESEIAGGAYICNTVYYQQQKKHVEECKSIKKEATTYVEEKKKKKKSITGQARDKLLSHVFRAGDMVKYLHANFIMIGEAQLRERQWLKLDGISVKKAPSVILVGYHQGTLDSPRFLPKETCDTTADLANSPVFEGYLPEERERRDKHIKALTGLFCCSDVPTCYPDYNTVLRKGYLSALSVIMNAILTNAQEFVVDAQVEAAASNQVTLERYKSFSSDAGKGKEAKGGKTKDQTKLKKSETLGTSRRMWYAATASLRKSLRWRLGSRSGSQSGSPTSSPLRSGSASPARSGSASPNLSRRQSASIGDVDIGLDLDPETQGTEEEARTSKRQRKAQLETLIKILLNTMIDPCILISSDTPAAESELKYHCSLYCDFLRTASLLFRTTKNSCRELRKNSGRCSHSHKACLCEMKSPKGIKDTFKDSSKVEGGFVWKEVKMSFCDNALRNNLTPISQCV